MTRSTFPAHLIDDSGECEDEHEDEDDNDLGEIMGVRGALPSQIVSFF